jgi:GNAT superfamily N-acetyltransferase
MAANVWEPLEKDPASAVALIEDLRKRMERAGRSEEIKHLEPPRDLIEHAQGGAILRDPNGLAIGMVLSQPVSGLGRMVEFFALKESHLTPSGVKEFLECLLQDDQERPPVLIVWDFFRLLDTPSATSFLRQLGFHLFTRYEMAFPPGRMLPSAPAGAQAEGRLRNVGPNDFDDLSLLNAVCFEGSIDSYLLATTSDRLENARRLIRDLLDGSYGRFLEYASFGLEVDGKLVGATLVTRHEENTLLADVVVLPEHRGKGYARRLIRASMEPLLREPGLRLSLNVTRENPRAFNLYSDIGFEVASGPYPLWAHTERLGIRPPESVEGYQ